jgi:hypothetical protein
MKYWPPLGVSDPDAPYINGNPEEARKGSIPPAEGFEHTMRETLAVIDYSKMTRDENDLEQLAKGVRSQRMNYCEDTGSVNTLSVALDPPIQAYTIGLPLHVRIRETNTGPSTIDAGAGRVSIRKPNGSEMAAGDLPLGGLAALVYDGTFFQMINFGGAGGAGGDKFFYKIPYAVDTSPTPNIVTVTFTGTGDEAITAYTAGLIFLVKIANTNTTFANINVNGLGLRPIYAQGGHPNWPLLAGDVQVGDVLVFVYDGSAFWIYPNNAITQNITMNVSAGAQLNQLFAALARKRIATSGSLIIKLAAGVYGPGTGGAAAILTYHPDSSRITLEGTMQAGQSPPTTGYFNRSGHQAPNRANDAIINLNMLRGRYATEIHIGSAPAVGLAHTGPGTIRYKNLLVIGPNVQVTGQRGFSVDANSSAYLEGCTAWGSGDVGFAASSGGQMTCWNCHANVCGSRGFAATGGSTMSITYGGSYSNGNAGTESSHGSSIGTQATDGATLSLGFQASCNPGAGMQSVAGYTLATLATSVANGVVDMYATNGGIVGLYLSSYSTTSPAVGVTGSDGSLMVLYG